MTEPNEVRIRPAIEVDLPRLTEIGRITWWYHYPGIISDEQIEYMLVRRYTVASLKFQIEQQSHQYFVAFYKDEPEACAFLSIQNVTKAGLSYLYIHRLYCLPSHHGLGIGKALLGYALAYAENHGHVSVRLNVHRQNPSYYFYLGNGFTVREEIDIPYGPYWLNDYIMEYRIPNS